MAPKRISGWRDQAAAELMCTVLGRERIGGRVLVMLEHLPEVADAVVAAGGSAGSWHRSARGGRSASTWVPAGPFEAAVLRLPKAKEELEMSVHAAASVLEVGAPLWVYGANDEGAGSVGRIVEPLFGPVRTVESGGRCRVVKAQCSGAESGLRRTLAEWRVTQTFDFPEGPRAWNSYPGVFAHGRFDEGTRTIVEALRVLPLAGGRVLDFACGSGLIGAFVSTFAPTAEVDFLDVDTVALVAVAENVPGACLITSDGFDALHHDRYHWIVSNPPYHEGKVESGGVLEGLVRGAPDHLEPEGSLVLVTQRRLAVAPLLTSTFKGVDVLVDEGPYRVWLANN